MGPGPPAAPTRCITPAAPISAALPLLRTSRDGFRAILKPSYADHRPYPLNSRNFGPTCLLPSERYRSSTGGRIVPNTLDTRLSDFPAALLRHRIKFLILMQFRSRKLRVSPDSVSFQRTTQCRRNVMVICIIVSSK